MNVPLWLWFATIAGILVLLAGDLFIVDHNPHAIRVGEAAKWVVFYVTCAVLFGLGILAFSGGQYAGEFFAGYITEYSLSVDNLFVFVIIMTTFGVPAIHQHKVLLFGILAALVLRGLFIAAGAAVIERFEWIFFFFGGFLLYTGWRLAFRGETDEEEEFKENAVLRLVRRFLPVTDEYHGSAVFTRIDGRRFVTPMLVVMLAIGTTDILFALDSIPAIFGLTKEPFLVFSSNAFALMGLRQLYFLLGGLLNRLVYLDSGLAVILGFIGVKLVLEALHGEGVSWAPEIGIVTSLIVIVLVLAVTTALSLLKVRRDPSAAKHLPTGRSLAPTATTPTPDVHTAGATRADPAAPRRAAPDLDAVSRDAVSRDAVSRDAVSRDAAPRDVAPGGGGAPPGEGAFGSDAPVRNGALGTGARGDDAVGGDAAARNGATADDGAGRDGAPGGAARSSVRGGVESGRGTGEGEGERGGSAGDEGSGSVVKGVDRAGSAGDADQRRAAEWARAAGATRGDPGDRG